MTQRELGHIVVPRHLLAAGAVSATTTAWLDTFAPYASPLKAGMQAKSATLFFDVGAGTTGTITAVIHESDDGSTDLGQMPDMYGEWFCDGVPGSFVGGVWTPSYPGLQAATLAITGANMANHVYSFDYIGGLHRYINAVITILSAPTNPIAVIGALGNVRETAGKVYTNYTYP
jgi:hypothetical protein